MNINLIITLWNNHREKIKIAKDRWLRMRPKLNELIKTDSEGRPPMVEAAPWLTFTASPDPSEDKRPHARSRPWACDAGFILG